METANEPKEIEGLDDLDEQTKASLEKENIKPKIKLDYTLHTFEDRCALVNQIVEQTPQSQLTHRYLEILADYALGGLSKEERKKRLIMTDNRLITINKRETSFEGICGKLENGEDGIYNMMSDLGKNTILTPKDPITEEDILRFPDLKILRDEIEKLEESYSKAVGKQKYIIKKALIEMRQNQYIIRNELRGCGFSSSGSSKASTGMVKSIAKTDFADKIHFDKDGNPDNSGTTGFGWFPGYAINVETGERLNIMFAENSLDTFNHGNDMIFNPTTVYALYRNLETGELITDEETGEPLAMSQSVYNSYREVYSVTFGEPLNGGRHYVYVCGSSGNTCSMPYRVASRKRNFNDG